MRKQTAQVMQMRTQYYESQFSKLVSSGSNVAGNSGVLSGKRRQERSSIHSLTLVQTISTSLLKEHTNALHSTKNISISSALV